MIIENVSFYYKEQKVLDSISTEFKPGKIYCIAGHNGAGKTTLLRLCLGLLSPKSGVIISENEKAGYMPEKNGLFEFLTVEQNAAFYKNINNIETNIDENLSRWKLLSEKNKLTCNLSTGQKKRLLRD